jgi:rhamnogalacturonyl hydrolase YesR
MPTSQALHEAQAAAPLFRHADIWEWEFHMDYLDVIRDLVDEGLFNEGRPEDQLAQSLMFRTLDDLSASERRLFEESLEPLLEVRCTDPDRFVSEYQHRRVGRSRNRQTGVYQAGRLAA